MDPRPRSHAAFARAQQLMPGGVNSPARAFGGVGGEPLFIRRAEGPCLCDLDGNRYIDYIGSWGPMILGHAPSEVVAAIEAAVRPRHQLRRPDRGRKRAGRADHRGRAVDREGAAGQLGHRGHDERHPAGPRVTRAGELVVKFAGNYHGHVDSLLVAAGSAAATLGVPNSPGVTAGTAKTRSCCATTTRPAWRPPSPQHGPQIAAVIVEPVAGNMGCVQCRGPSSARPCAR